MTSIDKYCVYKIIFKKRRKNQTRRCEIKRKRDTHENGEMKKIYLHIDHFINDFASFCEV